MKYVFPAFPVLSRSRLGLASPSAPCFGGSNALENLPTHLLASIYAITLPFSRFDDRLCVLNAYTLPPAGRLWRIAYEEILEAIHTPHLSVLQACLLYLQKPVDSTDGAIAETPFEWSFLSSTVGLAMSLGLHIDCQAWNIPPWEKRLRRRLWWLVHSEEKWRSLIQGHPAILNRDEWEVQPLRDDDFLFDYTTENSASTKDVNTAALDACFFRAYVDLSLLADEVHRKF